MTLENLVLNNWKLLRCNLSLENVKTGATPLWVFLQPPSHVHLGQGHCTQGILGQQAYVGLLKNSQHLHTTQMEELTRSALPLRCSGGG